MTYNFDDFFLLFPPREIFRATWITSARCLHEHVPPATIIKLFLFERKKERKRNDFQKAQPPHRERERRFTRGKLRISKRQDAFGSSPPFALSHTVQTWKVDKKVGVVFESRLHFKTRAWERVVFKAFKRHSEGRDKNSVEIRGMESGGCAFFISALPCGIAKTHFNPSKSMLRSFFFQDWTAVAVIKMFSLLSPPKVYRVHLSYSLFTFSLPFFVIYIRGFLKKKKLKEGRV